MTKNSSYLLTAPVTPLGRLKSWPAIMAPHLSISDFPVSSLTDRVICSSPNERQARKSGRGYGRTAFAGIRGPMNRWRPRSDGDSTMSLEWGLPTLCVRCLIIDTTPRHSKALLKTKSARSIWAAQTMSRNLIGRRLEHTNGYPGGSFCQISRITERGIPIGRSTRLGCSPGIRSYWFILPQSKGRRLT